jgi:phosphoribosyl 1,2-cyclic phosphodiesterase
MKLKVLGSSSKGNCYILENETSALIIEAGVSLKEVKKALNFNISKVAGCLISHEHGDHAKYVNEFIKAGIQVWMSKGTECKILGERKGKEELFSAVKMPNTATHRHILQLSCGFHFMPFDVQHDAAEPLGFLIHHSETGNIVFITDTHYIPFKFPDLNNIIIEANYDKSILDENFLAGRIPAIVRNRVMTSHMSIDTCVEALSANNLTKVNNIILIHLSDQNSHAENFKSKIEGHTGKRVYIADKGLEIDFNITDF